MVLVTQGESSAKFSFSVTELKKKITITAAKVLDLPCLRSLNFLAEIIKHLKKILRFK